MARLMVQQRLLFVCTAGLLISLLIAVREIRSTSLSCAVLQRKAPGSHWQPRLNVRGVRHTEKGAATPGITLRAVASADLPLVPTKSKLKIMNSMLSSCTTATGVLSVLRGETPSECDDITIATAIYQLALTRGTFQRQLAEDRVFFVLLKRARQMLQRSEMDNRPIAILMWAVAAARAEIPELQLLLPFATRELLHACDELDGRQVANALWGVATLWHYVPDTREALDVHRVVPRLANRAGTVCDAFNFQDYGNTLLALALLKKEVPAATETAPALMEVLAGKLEDGNLSTSDETVNLVGFARLVQALAVLDYKHQATFDSVARVALQVPADGMAVPLIDICCGFAKLGLRYKRLLQRLAKVQWNWGAFRDWDVAAFAWTLDKVDTGGTYSTLRQRAHAEASERGLTQEQIEHSRLGHMFWDDFEQGAPK